MPILCCVVILFIGIFVVVFGSNFYTEIQDEEIFEVKTIIITVVACVSIGIILILIGSVGLISGIRNVAAVF